jgi:hypothetical protein
MMLNHYDRERLAQAHRQDLLREADHERRLSQLPRSHRHILAAPVQLIVSLRALRIRLWQGLQRRIA